MMKKMGALLLSLMLLLLAACGLTALPVEDDPVSPQENVEVLDENGSYDSKEDVALYLHTYGHLPSNYITKKQAKALGWEQYVKASGMSMTDFEALVGETENTQASVGAYIQQHKITAGQANAIFKAFGWKTTYSEWLAKSKK